MLNNMQTNHISKAVEKAAKHLHHQTKNTVQLPDTEELSSYSLTTPSLYYFRSNMQNTNSNLKQTIVTAAYNPHSIL